jgi:glycine/D-amino acid oxidase-like deaminating enzyme
VARTDIVVLGAGIVGTSIALSLVKRGLSVTLIDRGEPGRGASYGNSGIKITPLVPAPDRVGGKLRPGPRQDSRSRGDERQLGIACERSAKLTLPAARPPSPFRA